MKRALMIYGYALLASLPAFSIAYEPPASAQAIPLPGSTASQPDFADYPAANAAVGASISAPIPGPLRHAEQAGSAASPYQELPLNINEAESRLDELQTLLPQSKPQEIQDSIMQLCQWLVDMSDAHNRLAGSFSKSDSTRHEANAEKLAAHKFNQLKNRAQLLKADLLIKEGRYPEALAPLVEIVTAEPNSETGQSAYQRLKEIGFSQEVAPVQNPVASAKMASQTAAPKARSKVSPRGLGGSLPARKISAKSTGNKSRRTWLSGSPGGSGRK